MTYTGKRGGTGLTTHGKKCLGILLWLPPPRSSLPRIWSAVGENLGARVESVSGGESERRKLWLAYLCVGNILVQPARLEVVLRLIRVGRDRGPCSCYRGGFDR